MFFFKTILFILFFSSQSLSASWNFKSNLDLEPPYNKCIEAIANGKDMGPPTLKKKKQYTNYFFENYIYEIIINSSFMTCVRVDLSKKQKPYPLRKNK